MNFAQSLKPLLVAFAVAAAPLSFADADAGAKKAQAAFFANLTKLCGATFEGASVFPNDPKDSFTGKKLTATVASCTADEIRIPFVVGEDRSRTWILKKLPQGLQLKHDHRHDDGTPDKITMYGGIANASGSDGAQSFPADEYTANLIPAAATNMWTLSLDQASGTLTYYLERDGKPRFKAELYRK